MSLFIPSLTAPALIRPPSSVSPCDAPAKPKTFPSSLWATRATWSDPEKLLWKVIVKGQRSTYLPSTGNNYLMLCLFYPEGRACAVVFDCKFIETSASLQHNVAELFEGVVRQIRLRRDGGKAVERRRSIYKRKESITQKARRFLDRLVARNNQRMAVKARSKSCHDLAVL